MPRRRIPDPPTNAELSDRHRAARRPAVRYARGHSPWREGLPAEDKPRRFDSEADWLRLVCAGPSAPEPYPVKEREP